MIRKLSWDWKTLQTAAPGSDLWPVTWGKDGALWAAFGDGGGFGGTNEEGRVAMGFARIEGGPEHFRGVNVNGGKTPEHPASYRASGKTGGILAVNDRLYAWMNMQNRAWPDVDQVLIWSDDRGASWQRSTEVFPSGKGRLKPSTFLNCGQGYSNLSHDAADYVYFYGPRQGEARKFYLGRARSDKLTDRRTYEYLSAVSEGRPAWSSHEEDANPVFSDTRPNGDLAGVVYVPGLKRYLLSSFHKGPGQLGVFDAPHPWGPWTTIAYYEDWGGMGTVGEGLTCSFPAKWMSDDGRTLWCIFSVYGEGAKQGIQAHDRFNLVRATLEVAP